MTNKPMLPCPFCGSDPFPLEWPDGGDTGEVRCLNLGCPIDDVFIPIEQWNRPRVKVDEIRQGKPADQHQGEPIYQVMYRGDGGGGWCDVEKDSYDMKVPNPKHWQTRIVYAEQPAPVAVVMPERQIVPDTLTAGLTRKWCEGWNDALEEVARLNGVKP